MINQQRRPCRSVQRVVPRLDGPALTLTDEHALLLDQVAVRAEDVVTAAAQDRWPHRELKALLDYLHAEVLRQVVDEERLLFPYRPTSPSIARLSRDHRRLRHCTEALADAASGESRCTLARLVATSRDLVAMLERHLTVEDAQLTLAYTPHRVPATAILAGRSREWYPRMEGTVIDLDVLPTDLAVVGMSTVDGRAAPARNRRVRTVATASGEHDG